jgi:hypothetical protein
LKYSIGWSAGEYPSRLKVLVSTVPWAPPGKKKLSVSCGGA